jgi:hypothetical protein
LLDRGLIVQEGEKLNLGRAQIDLGRLKVRFILHALQLKPCQIDLRNASDLVTLIAQVENMV